MPEFILDNNYVRLLGTISTELVFNHKVYGEGFYSFTLQVKRLSENSDNIPVLVSERTLGELKPKKGDKVEIDGQFRSYNNYLSEGNKLLLTVFVKSIKPWNENDENPNMIALKGYVCKSPIYRTTPFGREITDILLAVNRSYSKSDYIPCIAWGRNAKFAEGLKVGDNIDVIGRIQSRDYQKKLGNGETLTKTAFEVSASKLELIKKTD